MIFLAVAVVAIVTGALTTMGRSANSSKTDSSKAAASIVLKQGNDLKLAFERMVVEHGISPAAVMLYNESLYKPELRLVSRPLPPTSAFFAPGGAQAFSYNRKVLLPQVGSATRYDFVITLGALSLDTCRSINNLLHGDSLSANPYISTTNHGAWTSYTEETVINESATNAANFSGRTEGCVQGSSDARYVYYKVVGEDAAATTDTLPPFVITDNGHTYATGGGSLEPVTPGGELFLPEPPGGVCAEGEFCM